MLQRQETVDHEAQTRIDPMSALLISLLGEPLYRTIVDVMQKPGFVVQIIRTTSNQYAIPTTTRQFYAPDTITLGQYGTRYSSYYAKYAYFRFTTPDGLSTLLEVPCKKWESALIMIITDPECLQEAAMRIQNRCIRLPR